MPDELLPLACRSGRPAAARLDHEVGMVLAQVVQVVGDASPHEARAVVLQELEQLEHPARVGFEPGNACGPRQAQPRAFRDEATHMWVLVPRPGYELCEGSLGITR